MRTLQTQPVPNGDVVRIIMHEQGLLLRRKRILSRQVMVRAMHDISHFPISPGALVKRITCVCKKYSLILWAIR